MRRLAWPIAAVAFFIAAIGIWSSLGKAAGLIGAYDANLTAQPSAAAAVAYRFPRAGESFRS